MTNALLLFFVKLTLILMIGGVTAVLLRRRSAAARHFVWALTLGSALLLPIASRFAPALPLPIPDWRDPQLVEMTTPDRGAAGSQPAVSKPSGVVSRPGGLRARRSTEVSVAAVWLVGFAAILLWLGAGHLAVWRIARAAAAADDDDWRALIAEARERIQVRRPVRVVLSSAVGAPFTSGWSRPVILLPAEASGWPEERRRAALLHELAHIARNDAPIHLLAGLACALYWLHPAVWLALRRLRRESEQATDDRVIAHGMVAPEYAAQLIDVARASAARGHSGLAAVAMACPSHLESRLRALLDETRNRGAVSRRLAALATALVALLLVPLATARPEVRAKRAAPASSTSSIYEHTEDAKSGGTLVLDLETGADVAIRGDDLRQVEIRGILGGRDADNTVVDTTTSGDEVRLSAKFERKSGSLSTSHDFTIRIPRQFNVRLKSSGGDVTIAGVSGTFSGSTGGGTIELTNVQGNARISTGGGDIYVTDSELDGRVSTGGGTVRFERVRGGLRGDSGSGPVIRGENANLDYHGATKAVEAIEAIPADIAVVSVNAKDSTGRAEPARVLPSGLIEITKAGGAVDLREAPHGAVISTGGGRIIVGSARGSVDASTGGGQIRIGPVAGSARASTGAGSVMIDVADAGGEAQTIEVTTGHGSVEVRLPANFDGRFEIETAYTASSDPVEIRSEWQLQRDPVTDWDAREGTPRRYVRARGSAGSGRGLVHIRAVNGNVVIGRD